MAPAAPPDRTAATTAAKSPPLASGRAASWTTMMAAASGTAASPGPDRLGPGGASRHHDDPARTEIAARTGRRCRDPVLGGNHQHHPVGNAAGRFHRPCGDRTSTQQEELLGTAEPAARSAGDHDRPDRTGSVQGSASLRRTSAVSSSTPRAKVSSETRIWRARLSIRFSPAERPLSLSRMERFLTTSATW